MAVDPIRDRIRIIHIVFAQEPGASSLLALVCSVGKIPDSLVITSRYWEPSTVATRLHGNACRAVRRDGAGQPTLHTVDDAGDLSTDSVDSFPEYGSSASSPFYSRVALRICDGSLRMVCALESDFPSHSGSHAITRRARSGSAAPDRVYYRNAATNRTAIVASFSGTWNFRHRPARFGMAGGYLRTSRRCRIWKPFLPTNCGTYAVATIWSLQCTWWWKPSSGFTRWSGGWEPGWWKSANALKSDSVVPFAR